MLTKITAEFDSIESAEFAIRAIKSHTSDCRSITMRAHKPDENINYVPFLFSMRSEANFAPNFLPIVFNSSDELEFFHSNVSEGKPEASRSAFVEILCDKRSESEIKGIISNHGGLKINKL